GLNRVRTEDPAERRVDEVRGGMSLGRPLAPLRVHRRSDELPRLDFTVGDDTLVDPQLLAHLLHVVDLHPEPGAGDLLPVPELAAGFRVPRSAREDESDGPPLRADRNRQPAPDES